MITDYFHNSTVSIQVRLQSHVIDSNGDHVFLVETASSGSGESSMMSSF